MVYPDAAPVAHHAPVPVPAHWQEEVKAGLDRDVRLGVIEPVPVGDPVTYCHSPDGHMREEEWETKAERGHAVSSLK